ncbi:QueT transporter family protein [Bacillaceae bacterium]
MRGKTYEIVQLGLLAGLIAISGTFKIPGPVAGAEFQLSAPIAVAIAAVFGFWRYLAAGILASLILLMLGVHNILNFEISMVFRLVAGGIVALCGSSFPVLMIAGPLGTAAARWVLAFTLGLEVWPLLLAALPGMIFTACTVWPIKKLLEAAVSAAGSRHVKRTSV